VVRLPVFIHSMVGHFMGLSLEQVVEGFHGVEAVAGSLVAGEGFVDGSDREGIAWGPSMELRGSDRTSSDV